VDTSIDEDAARSVTSRPIAHDASELAVYRLLSVMQGLSASVQSGDEAAFVAMMKQGNSYLETTG
jgi:hypothetical protein